MSSARGDAQDAVSTKISAGRASCQEEDRESISVQISA